MRACHELFLDGGTTGAGEAGVVGLGAPRDAAPVGLGVRHVARRVLRVRPQQRRDPLALLAPGKKSRSQMKKKISKTRQRWPNWFQQQRDVPDAVDDDRVKVLEALAGEEVEEGAVAVGVARHRQVQVGRQQTAADDSALVQARHTCTNGR